MPIGMSSDTRWFNIVNSFPAEAGMFQYRPVKVACGTLFPRVNGDDRGTE